MSFSNTPVTKETCSCRTRSAARARKKGRLKTPLKKERSKSMSRTLLSLGIAVAAALLQVAPAHAHHAFAAEFDIKKPIKLQGTVTSMDWINPHAWIHIDVKGPDGKAVNWMVEGGSPNVLLRRGFTKDSLLPGTEVIVEGYQAKSGE